MVQLASLRSRAQARTTLDSSFQYGAPCAAARGDLGRVVADGGVALGAPRRCCRFQPAPWFLRTAAARNGGGQAPWQLIRSSVRRGDQDGSAIASRSMPSIAIGCLIYFASREDEEEGDGGDGQGIGAPGLLRWFLSHRVL